jgi:hypothetical protein
MLGLVQRTTRIRTSLLTSITQTYQMHTAPRLRVYTMVGGRKFRDALHAQYAEKGGHTC